MPEFTFAFQPIVNTRKQRTASFEALIRGPGGEPPYSVLDAVPDTCRSEFEAEARTVAVRLAAELGLTCQLNVNCLPNNFVNPERTVAQILDVLDESGMKRSNLVLEVTEQELIADKNTFLESVQSYRRAGIRIAIDDFGAGYSGLSLLADFQPDSLKLDRHLIQDIQMLGPKQAIVRGVLQTCIDLGVDVVAEGVETADEYHWCINEGVELFQGYLFAKPGLRQLPEAVYPQSAAQALI